MLFSEFVSVVSSNELAPSFVTIWMRVVSIYKQEKKKMRGNIRLRVD